MSNILQANFVSSARQVTTKPLWQYDYGQALKVEGLSLPEYYEVHFSNENYDGEAKIVMGDSEGVKIPDEYLASGEQIKVWIVLHQGMDDGETVYKISIPVNRRAKPIQDPPTTEKEQTDLTRAIALLEHAVSGDVIFYDDTEVREAIALINETLLNKVDSVEGKGLSTNDFTDELKTLVESVETLDAGVDISAADYAALSEEEKMNGSIYFVSD